MFVCIKKADLDSQKFPRTLSRYDSTLPPTPGHGVFAINSWYNYHNVITKAVEIKAGKEVMIQVEPVVHMATEEFKDLGEEKMGCRPREREAQVIDE